MKNALFILLIFSYHFAKSQSNAALDTTSVDPQYFVTTNREELMSKLAALSPTISIKDDVPTTIQKLEVFLKAYQPDKRYPDDVYAKESNVQALKSVKEGGYGIGAVLIDSDGKIILGAHNEQIQKHRSDLHGEMTLLTKFEESPQSAPYLNSYMYKPGLTVFSSAEPCPMCFIRLASARVDTKYSTPGPDDGMVSRVSCLPGSWQRMAARRSFKKGNCSPTMQKLSHLLFYSALLDGRGPK